MPLVDKLFDLKQYGFQPSDFGVARIPAGLQIRCWEAKNLDTYFPSDRVPELLSRRAEREQARQECERIVGDMDDVEKTEFLKGDKTTEKGAKKAMDTEDKPDVEMAAPPSTSDAVPSPAKSRGTRENSTASEYRARSVSPSKRGKELTPEEVSSYWSTLFPG